MPGYDELEDALKLKRAGELDKAVIALEGVLGRQPAHALALAHLAEVQLRRGRRTEAAQCLDRADAVAGTTGFTARLRGDVYYKGERFAEAARCYQDADALGDRGTWSLVQLARCRLRLRDVEGAIGAAAKAVERQPNDSGGWVVLGDIARRDGRSGDAEELYLRAHEVAPHDDFAYARLVEARVMALPPEARSREVEVLLKTTARGNTQLQGVLARLRAGQGDLGQAAEMWAKTLAAKGDAYSRRMYAFSLLKAARTDEAAALLAQCLADDPTNVIVFRNYVNLQHKRVLWPSCAARSKNSCPGPGRGRERSTGSCASCLSPTPVRLPARW
ncbi:MAG: tetratricopeptide repeat protein [Acidimicrobiales bacterium]